MGRLGTCPSRQWAPYMCLTGHFWVMFDTLHYFLFIYFTATIITHVKSVRANKAEHTKTLQNSPPSYNGKLCDATFKKVVISPSILFTLM